MDHKLAFRKACARGVGRAGETNAHNCRTRHLGVLLSDPHPPAQLLRGRAHGRDAGLVGREKILIFTPWCLSWSTCTKSVG